MTKISFIGAGSTVFAKNLITDILTYPELRDTTISLMDIDRDKLEVTSDFASQLISEQGLPTQLETTTDREKSFQGADYIISMIQVGGIKAFELDIDIPRQYGINQAVGDTVGPGGIFRGLRSIPVYLEMAREIERICPEALFINYANPMAINCWALNEATDVKNVGLCHSVQGTAKDISEYLDVSLEEVNYRSAGINHMAWFLEYRKNGKDLYPRLKEKYHDRDVYKQDVTKFEFLKHFGYFVTESSIHMSEYVPYFRNSESWLEKIHQIEREKPPDEDAWTTEDESGVYLKTRRKKAKAFDKNGGEDFFNELPDISRSREYCSRLIHSLETDKPRVIHGNVKNTSLIENLPDDCTVEVPCLVDKNGVQPTKVGELPSQLAALNRTNINTQKLAVEGALEGSKDAIYQALMLDPLTSSTLDLNQVKKMADEMFRAQRQYLPLFWFNNQ